MAVALFMFFLLVGGKLQGLTQAIRADDHVSTALF
jgi:hypothetical protein